jgi:hypothetical protein
MIGFGRAGMVQAQASVQSPEIQCQEPGRLELSKIEQIERQ